MTVRIRTRARRQTRWCFEIRLEDRLIVRNWGEELVEREAGSGRPIRIINVWIEYRTEDWGLRRRPSRTFTHLRTDLDLRPLEFTVFDEAGRRRWAVEFSGGQAIARYADGTVIGAALAEADFLMAGNSLPHLTAKVADLISASALPYDGAFFAPEVLQAVPYTLDGDGGRLRSNLGEELIIEDGRLRELHLPSAAVVAKECRRPTPRWPPTSKDGTIEERPPRYEGRPNYRPPAGVELAEGSVPSRIGSTIGYTVARSQRQDPVAWALFLGGSGAHDRHGFAGDIDLGYHQLLDELTRWGVTSLRFDKRGSGTTPIGEDAYEYGFEGLLDDASRCLTVVRHNAREDKVPLLLIGHSEGGLAALVLASRIPVDGVVLLSTAARPLGRLLVEQIRARGSEFGLSEAVVEAQVARFEEFLHAVRDVDVSDWVRGRVPDRVLSQRALAGYYRELLAYDPLDLVASLQVPVLIVHGEHDQQVPADDARLLASAARGAGGDSHLVVVPGANHLLKSSSAEPTVVDYFDRRRRIVHAVPEAIGSWVKRLSGSP